MAEKLKQVGEHESLKVYLDQYCRFFVVEIENKQFDTYRSAQAAIEEYNKSQAAAARKKVEIEAFTTDGDAVLITGLNYGTGLANTKPLLSSRLPPDKFIPAVKWLSEAIAFKKQLEGQVRQVEAVINKFRFAERNAHGFASASDHTAAVDALLASNETLVKKAAGTNLAEQLAKTPVPQPLRWR